MIVENIKQVFNSISQLLLKHPYKLILYLLSGSLWGLGQVGFSYSFLQWFALVPIILLFQTEKKYKHVFLYGTAAGTIAHSLNFYFIAIPLKIIAGFPVVLVGLFTLVFNLYLGLQYGFLGILYLFLKKKLKLLNQIIIPISFLVIEKFYFKLFHYYIANAQADNIPLIQITDLFGVLFISFLIFYINSAIVDIINDLKIKKLKISKLLPSCLLLILTFSYGFMRISQIDKQMEKTEKIKVALIQGNISGLDKQNAANYKRSLDIYQSLTESTLDQNPDLIIWPESSLPGDYIYVNRHSHKEIIKNFYPPLLTGIISIDPPNTYYNSAILLRKNGYIMDMYHKNILVPFSEFLPFENLFPWLRKLSPMSNYLTTGNGPKTFKLNKIKLTPNICYEDIYNDFIRQSLQEKAQIIVNMTNNSWFGKTSGSMSHLKLALFRSVENKRSLIHCTCTGISAVIDPLGRIVEKTGLYEENVIVAEVPLMSLRTNYLIYGDLFGWFITGGLFILLILAFEKSLQNRKKRNSSASWD